MKKEEIQIPSLAPAISHYTNATKFGNLVFISGMTARDSEGVIGKGDIVRQTRHIFESIKVILARTGATFADVLKVTVYLRNIEDRQKINPIREEYFGSHRPASTLVEVSKLVLEDLLVEIDAIVGIPQETG